MKKSRSEPSLMFCWPYIPVGRFHPSYRPRRPVGIVEVQHYSAFRPRHQKGLRDQRNDPDAFYPRERTGTHCTGGWVGPRAGLDGWNISPHRDSISGPSSLQSVAMPTELPGPHSGEHCCLHLPDKMKAHSTGTLMPTYQTTRCLIPIFILSTETRLSHCICARVSLKQYCAHSQFVFTKPVVRSGVTFYVNIIIYFVCKRATGPCISCPSTE